MVRLEVLFGRAARGCFERLGNSSALCRNNGTLELRDEFLTQLRRGGLAVGGIFLGSDNIFFVGHRFRPSKVRRFPKHASESRAKQYPERGVQQCWNGVVKTAGIMLPVAAR
jgi:hypothetical protein